MDCLFCKIVSKENKADIIYEDDLVIAILDLYPDAPGHTLIIPKKHYTDIMELDDEMLAYEYKVAKDIANKIITKLDASGVKFIVNYLEPQFIKHFHLHVIPTYKDKIEMTREEVYDKLKESK